MRRTTTGSARAGLALTALLATLLPLLLAVPSAAHADPVELPTEPGQPAEPTEPTEPAPVRILPIGDSVTQGATADYTWRFRLQASLRARGVDVDFVGDRTAAIDPATRAPAAYADGRFDQDHAALWGMRAEAPASDVRRLTATTRPDVVVLALGVNDLLRGRAPRAVLADLERIIGDVRSVAPRAAFVLPELTQTWLAGVDDLNRLLRSTRTRLSTSASPVVVPALATPFVKGADTWDHLHPNGVGEVKIAQQVQLGLHWLGVGPRPVTPSSYPAAGPPRRLDGVTTASAHRAVGARWSFPAGVTTVQVSYRDVTGNGRWTTYGAPVTSDRVVVRGLQPGRTYDVVLNPGRHQARSAAAYSTVVRVRAG